MLPVEITKDGIHDVHRLALWGIQSDVLFSFGSSSYQSGCTVTAVSAQKPVEYVKNNLQNITTEWTPHSVLLTLFAAPSSTIFKHCCVM